MIVPISSALFAVRIDVRPVQSIGPWSPRRRLIVEGRYVVAQLARDVAHSTSRTARPPVSTVRFISCTSSMKPGSNVISIVRGRGNSMS